MIHGSGSEQAAPVVAGDLVVSGLDVRAGGRALLSGVNLQLRPGELCGLIGPSGAGKSTLFKALLGLRRPHRGTISLAGAPLQGAAAIGYVPQDDALHRSLSVRRALYFTARLRLPGITDAAIAERIGAVCAQVGLSDRMDLRIARLSGGQRKRVSVAMELLTAPPILILDEPTSGLDPRLEAQLMGLFADLAAGGRVVLCSTHAMRSLQRCHVLVVLVTGHVAYAGTPEGALAWFRAADLPGVFDRLPLRTPEAWARVWANSDERRAFAARPAPTGPAGAAGDPPTPAGAPADPPKPSAAAQLAALKRAMGREPSE